MKIIGVSALYRQENWKYIVELDTSEMERICRISQHHAEKLHAGSVVDVSKQWDDAMACRAACEAAAKLPATLRATADCMEAVADRVRAIAEETQQVPTEGPTA